ncbi:MAG: hypothetical protein IPK00_17910 [Deltaproteobacteria bacterium]|nr:hypothetical protein [Deltaproteobacteria bacterium]
MFKRILAVLAISVFLLGQPSLARASTCSNGRSSTAAMWLSILHPGLGEWHLQGWGSFGKVPQKKFWMGFIPLFGFPYLTVVSAIDTANCRIDDNLNVGAVEAGVADPSASAIALRPER